MLTLNYAYRIYPDATQEQKLLEWLEICRKAYNYALRQIKDWVNSRKCSLDYCSLQQCYIIPSDAPFPGYYRQQNALPKAKKQYPELPEVPAQALQITIRHLHDVWEYFQNRGYGFPRFKKYGQFKSLVFPQFKANPVTGWQINLPKLGLIPINLHRPLPDGFVVKQVRVISKAVGWFAVVTLEADVDLVQPQPHGHAIGIGLGVERLLTTSDREFIKRPRFLTKLQRELELLQRRYSRKKKGSRNREKARIEVAKLHNHIAFVRKDFHFKLAHHLCDQAGTIFVEDLNLKALNQGIFLKPTLDAGFCQFLNILAHVCWKRGVYFARVNPDSNFQTCPKCNTSMGKQELSKRIHQCGYCGYETDRDHAAAEVVRMRGLAAVGLAVVEDACEEVLPEAIASKQDSVKQESPFVKRGSPRHTA